MFSRHTWWICSLLIAVGLLVMFFTAATPTAPSRPYDIVVGNVGDDCPNGDEPNFSQFYFDSRTGSGLLCGRDSGHSTGYFTSAEVSAIIAAANRLHWEAGSKNNRQDLLAVADQIALGKGLDVHPAAPSPTSVFIASMGQVAGGLLITLALILAALASRRRSRFKEQ